MRPLFSTLTAFILLTSCLPSSVEDWELKSQFISIDIRENGKCPFPLLVMVEGDFFKILDQDTPYSFIYSNPTIGQFGGNTKSIDAPLYGTGMYQQCRFYYIPNSSDASFTLHIINLQTGKEAHETINLTPIQITEMSGCKTKFTADSSGFKQMKKCGDSMAQVVQLTIELQTPEDPEEFSWIDEMAETAECSAEE
ncbi:hypothetical protein KKF34_03540 [Myxococcota bacterium]|nr:hypothetical protein [Myxococcota bacterium]MBU1380441.1 hypothetical protein [Myxococcota bacterium]MBU1495930.1 hypothetical protein [Myxococcota bacterium]